MAKDKWIGRERERHLVCVNVSEGGWVLLIIEQVVERERERDRESVCESWQSWQIE